MRSQSIYKNTFDYSSCLVEKFHQSLTAIIFALHCTYNGYGNGPGYSRWFGNHRIRYTAEEYGNSIISSLFEVPYYTYFNDASDFYVTTQLFESSTSVVIRRNVYDGVGNLLDVGTLSCFCTADYCNSDFETCAAGINYNRTDSTSTSTSPGPPSASSSSPVSGTHS